MLDRLNVLFRVGMVKDSAPGGFLKQGLPANDFWASLALSLLVLAALIHAVFYLHDLTRKKRE